MPLHTDGGRQPMGPADYPEKAQLSRPELAFLTAREPADPQVVVGVVDTGVATLSGQPHPYLAGHLAELGPRDTDTLPTADLYAGHGTFVAGRILLEAPAATIDMRRALAAPYDRAKDNDAAVAAAIRDLGRNPYLSVLNLSFAGNWAEDEPPEEIGTALRGLREDVIVVAATVNRWTDRTSWPAAFTEDLPSVLAVGAVDETVIPEDPGPTRLPPPRASFSSRWPGINLYASGTRVLGPTVWDGVAGWGRWSGTSFAAATVSGILARERIEHPDWRAWLAHRPSVEGKPYLKSRELGALGYVGGAGVG